MWLLGIELGIFGRAHGALNVDPFLQLLWFFLNSVPSNHKVPFLTKKLFTIKLMPSVKGKVSLLQWCVTGPAHDQE